MSVMGRFLRGHRKRKSLLGMYSGKGRFTMKKTTLALALAMSAVAATASAAPLAEDAAGTDVAATDAVTDMTATAEDAIFDDAEMTEAASSVSYEDPKLFDDARGASQNIAVSARYFRPKLTAKVKSDDIQQYYTGNQVDLVDTLNIDDKSSAPELIFSFRNMKLDYIHFSTDGKANLTDEPIKVNDYEFNGSAKTDLDFDYLKFDITNPLLHTPNFHLDWSYGLTGMRWKAKVQGDATVRKSGQVAYNEHRSETADFAAPIPMIGLKASAAIGNNFSAHAAISGLPLGNYGHIFDSELGIAYFPADNVDIQAGYRIIDLKIDRDDDYGQFKLAGPWAGVRVWF